MAALLRQFNTFNCFHGWERFVVFQKKSKIRESNSNVDFKLLKGHCITLVTTVMLTSRSPRNFANFVCRGCQETRPYRLSKTSCDYLAHFLPHLLRGFIGLLARMPESLWLASYGDSVGLGFTRLFRKSFQISQ